MKFDFGTISERDMDMMFLNAFYLDKGFLKLFTDKADFPKADFDVTEVVLSKTDKDGESDITVIIKAGRTRYGLLIEDKIDAIDMPDQPERYIKRGEKGVKNKNYESFYSFIVCPEKYYNNNDAAKRYQFVVTYEEVLEYFNNKSENQYSIYCQQLSQAIEKAKKPPKVEIDERANCFYGKYKDYQEAKYPHLNLRTKRESNGYWAKYSTRFGSVYLIHKISDGNIDLTFEKASKHMDKLEVVADWLKRHGIENVVAVVTGKAGALRIKAPKLDMQIPFEENDEYDIEVCFKTISELIEAANVFGVAGEVSELK